MNQLLGGVSHADYHADIWGPSLSRSAALAIVAKSPLHAWAAHPRLGNCREADDSEPKDNGTLVHSLLLGGGPSIRVIDAPDWRKAVDREERDEARERGEIPVLSGAYEKACATADAIAKRVFAEEIDLGECSPEQVALWVEDGVLCRGRLDLWRRATATAYDLKILEDANPAAFARRASTYGLDIQWAAYVDGLETIFPDLAGRVSLEFLLCERRPPHDVVRVGPRGSLKALGQSRWRRALRTWRECLASGFWPGRGGKLHTVEAPSWALTEELTQSAGGSIEDPAWFASEEVLS